MAGMAVTVNFTGGGSETVSWAATGAVSGAATGTGWSISLGGDSYNNLWNVDFGALNIASMELDGRSGLTLFDIANGVDSTTGSALGRTFVSNLVDDALVTVTYSNIVAIGADAAVGDLFSVMTVDFSQLNNTAGASGRFSFLQDTDNDVRIEMPEPGTLGLLGAALVGFGITRRRNRKAA